MQERWFFKIKHKLSLSNGVYEIISTFNREQLFKLIALTKSPLIFLHLNKSSLSNTEKYTSKLLTLESSILLLLKSLTCFHNFLSRAISDSCLHTSLSFTNCSVVKYSKMNNINSTGRESNISIQKSFLYYDTTTTWKMPSDCSFSKHFAICQKISGCIIITFYYYTIWCIFIIVYLI